MDVGAVRAPTIRRSLSCKRSPPPWRSREAAAVPGWDRGLRNVASFVARTQALGHNVRLMPPASVKPYVKRQKKDATDAEGYLVPVVGEAL
jgi:hypothetical protein